MGEYLQQQYRNSERELNDIERKRRIQFFKTYYPQYLEKYKNLKEKE